jgi:hypothetical protein
LQILRTGGPGCFVWISYELENYCVPIDAYKTATVLDILVQLRNLAITPNDLNSGFSVRLIN